MKKTTNEIIAERRKQWEADDIIAKLKGGSNIEDWYNVDGIPTPFGAYDAAGHFYAERCSNY